MDNQTLGRYRVVRELGRGAMGRVYLAHDPEIDRQVAVKTIQVFSALPEQERTEARDRFVREARAAGRLLHPGIVTVFDVGESDGIPYLAMEYVEGVSLDAFCSADSRLPVERTVEIVADAAEALGHAHRNGIVHRDIKPSNLMRVGDNAVKIMDFGLAKSAETHLTQDGMLLGTPNYMSPEHIRGEPVDARSDLFSLGVVLFELLTGEKPFPGDSISSVLYRIVNEPPREVPEDRRVPPRLRSFLAKALAKDPAARFRSGEEFASALRTAVGQGAGRDRVSSADAPQAESLPPPVHAPSRGSSALVWSIGVLVIAAAAVGAWYVWSARREASTGGEAVPAAWLEASVRTEPPGLPVLLDGVPVEGGVVRFPSAPPHGVLEAIDACRRATRPLEPADAATEIVLVPDPVRADVRVEPGIEGATVAVDDGAPATAPVSLDLDLCESHVVEIAAVGHRTARIEVDAGLTPLEARTLLASVVLDPIPKGTLEAPRVASGVALYLDGERFAGAREVDAGVHRLRAVDERHWIDVTQEVDVAAGETVRPKLDLPGLAWLEVQAYPSNCQVDLRKEGGKWRFVDETPVRVQVAAGTYEVRVRYLPTGESRQQSVRLQAGKNPPVRASFAGDGS